MSSTIGNKSALLKFEDSFTNKTPVVKVNDSSFYGQYLIENITTVDKTFSFSIKNDLCSYNWTMTIDKDAPISTITFQTSYQNGCSLQIKKIDGQSDSAYKEYSNQISQMITSTEFTPLREINREVNIGGYEIFGSILIGITAAITISVLKIKRAVKEDKFLSKEKL